MVFPKINFSWLAKISTGRAPILRGLLPPVGSLAALMGVALMISGGWWLLAGAQAASAMFLPFYLKTFAAVCGLTIANFVFAREIRYALRSCRSIEDNYLYDRDNPTDVQKMVESLNAEVNNFFRNKYPDSHVDMPAPRLATYKEGHTEFETVPGMNPWHASIMFAHGFFWEHHSCMNQRQEAAIITKQLVKIYMRRQSANLIVRMGLDMLETLQALKEASPLFRLLGVFTWPLKFLFLVERAQKRASEFEASRLVAEMGRGFDLYHFYDIDPSPTLFQKPEDLAAQRATKKRKPYEGPMKWLFGPIHQWIVDNLELPNEHHENNIIMVALGGIVRESIFYLNELDSPNPRGTNEKIALLEAFQAVHQSKMQEDQHYRAANEVEKLNRIGVWDRELNRKYQPEESARYNPVGPDGNGFSTRISQPRHQNTGVSDEADLDAVLRGGRSTTLTAQQEHAMRVEPQHETQEAANEAEIKSTGSLKKVQ